MSQILSTSPISEGFYNVEWLIREATEFRSRDMAKMVNPSGGLISGTVLAKTGTLAAQVVTGTNTGNGVFTIDGSTPLVAGVQRGAYRVTFVEPVSNLGTFEVEAPDGFSLGTGVVGTAFTNQIKFAIADGSTDFVAGDSFTVYVRPGTIAAGGANTGNGVATLYNVDPAAQQGTYLVTCTTAASNGGTFTVTDPDGDTIGTVVVGTRTTGGIIDMLIADGSTDFIVGDYFTLALTSNVYKAWSPGATDGSHVASAILWHGTKDQAAGTIKIAVISRDAEVDAEEMLWPAAATGGQKLVALSQLSKVGIIGRGSAAGGTVDVSKMSRTYS